MPRRITLTLSDDTIERLTNIATYEEQTLHQTAVEMIQDSVAYCEEMLLEESNQQIQYLAAVPPIGTA